MAKLKFHNNGLAPNGLKYRLYLVSGWLTVLVLAGIMIWRGH